MSDATVPTNPLTVNDPVDFETMKQIEDLSGRWYDLGGQLLELEQRKVGLLVASKGIDQEKARIFNQILVSRGLPPNTPIEIEAETGKIVIVRQARAATPDPEE